MDDQLPVWVTIEAKRYCDCCKHTHMKTVFKISHATLFDDIQLGYVCASRWFDIDLSGNKSKARRKLQQKLNSLSEDDLMSIVDEIEAEKSS